MLALLSRNWWTFAVRGLVAVLFGVAAFVWPKITWEVLVIALGAYVLLDGFLALVAALESPFIVGGRGWLILQGILGVVVGIVTLLWLHTSSVVLVYLIAAWAIVTGTLEIVAATELRNEIEHAGWFILTGSVSVLVGVLLAWQPSAGAVALAWLLGAFAIVYGIVQLVIAFRLHDVDKQITSQLGEIL